jgi:hypothetical protein
MVGVILLFTLFWNGITSIFVIIACVGILKGQPDFCLTLFVVPFVLAGIALIVGLVRVVLVTVLCRPAAVEIAVHPLAPGEKSRLYFGQRGLLRLHKVKVLVACEETASNSTSERTYVKRVHETDTGCPEDALEFRAEFVIPPGAMHSFKASHNQVDWMVLVQGKAGGWFSIDWVYPFVVRPASFNSKSKGEAG